MTNRCSGRVMRRLRYLKAMSVLVFQFPIQISRLISLRGWSAIRLKVVSASWGKRWFLQIGSPMMVEIGEIQFPSADLRSYLRLFSSLAERLGSVSLQEFHAFGDQRFTKQEIRAIQLLNIKDANLQVLFYFDNRGNVVLRDGLRRLAVAKIRGLKSISAIPVLPVKMLSGNR